MPQKQRARQLGADRAGLDDFAGSGKSGSSLLPTGVLRQAAAARLRRQRQVERLHRLGPRPLFELIDEIARHHPEIAGDIDQRLARYAATDPALLAAVGGHSFPSGPIRVVGSGR